MEEIPGNIYCLFESLFGQDLGEYLWGYNCQTLDYSGTNLFNAIGLVTLLVTLLLVTAYYYLPLYLFNHPRTNRWWNWLIILLITGGISYFIASGWTLSDLLNGEIGDCLLQQTDEEGNTVQLISKTDCMLFGVTNFIISSFIFIFFTFLLKWWSPNCRYSPL